ncbi:oxidoreductase, short chain dehydrogenase/reductase family protein [Teladorsagia circumcincta]|uniref:Oxidoreductase, short chain dehydrogenase/reductase family protein n=1 Tax=Teladorsagia circumcincta TaxID=45464 RepID=A0A2G9TZS9_TELCI|nr:oxidoreductase, short chain dehydrogenase/reductase family protein [Teladorsagia circumcincta]
MEQQLHALFSLRSGCRCAEMALGGQVAIVTGASRGIGRGIALQLGEAGATVYVTGRKPSQSDAAVLDYLPKLEQVANEITSRGGRGIAAFVDHSNMDEVKAFFERVERDHNGQLDILTLIGSAEKPFYECPPEMWDEVNNVGLRNHYYCSVYAARMMANNRSGLIVNVSSAGGLRYLFNVPYGVGKQALDRMSADMAVELKASRDPPNLRSLSFLLSHSGYKQTAELVPSWKVQFIPHTNPGLCDKHADGVSKMRVSKKKAALPRRPQFLFRVK